jgi:hypothetical protein
MFSVCANPNCQAPFDYPQGRLFRFRKDQQLVSNLRTLIPCNISGCAAAT